MQTFVPTQCDPDTLPVWTGKLSPYFGLSEKEIQTMQELKSKGERASKELELKIYLCLVAHQLDSNETRVFQSETLDWFWKKTREVFAVEKVLRTPNGLPLLQVIWVDGAFDSSVKWRMDHSAELGYVMGHTARTNTEVLMSQHPREALQELNQMLRNNRLLMSQKFVEHYECMVPVQVSCLTPIHI